MTFWRLESDPALLAAVDANPYRRWTYGDLKHAAYRVEAALPALGRKRLGLVFCRNLTACLAGYLAGLRAADAVCLSLASLAPELEDELVARYRPDWIWSPEADRGLAGYTERFRADGFRLDVAIRPESHVLSGDLSLLLSTSGTTGSSKLVRLSPRNLAANAAAIAEYLGLSAAQRPITTLPLSYSYGLSVVNSHLQVGATILFTEDSVVDRRFWDFFRSEGATSLAGVPYLYQTLGRLGLGRMKLPTLRTLTQAGGHLSEQLTRDFAAYAADRGITFFVMYGQTEATARMSYVPPARLADKVGSIGIPIPGGDLTCDPDTSELLYRGPNVMLGYAAGPADLARGDELGGVLRTGDLGRQDPEGFHYVTGRMNRYLKILGLRIGLSEVERLLEARIGGPAACLGEDEKLLVVVEASDHVDVCRNLLQELLHLPAICFAVRATASLPRQDSGKIDYARLAHASLQPASDAWLP